MEVSDLADDGVGAGQTLVERVVRFWPGAIRAVARRTRLRPIA
jgi:hypothetical protein